MNSQNKLLSFKGRGFLSPQQMNLPFCIVDAGIKILQEGERDIGNGVFKDFIEIIWCVKGRGHIFLYDKSYIVSEGDAFYYLEREDHEFLAISADWTLYWLCFNGPLAEPIMRSFKYPRHQHISEPCPLSLFSAIFHHKSPNDMIENGIACSRVLEIIARMNATRQLQLHPDTMTSQVIGFIRNNLANPELNIDLVADTFSIPKSTLQKYFFKHTQITLGEYIRNERFQKAMALLQNTSLPIQEIAHQTGYKLLSSFSRLIHRGTSFSPLNLRQRALEQSRQNGKPDFPDD